MYVYMYVGNKFFKTHIRQLREMKGPVSGFVGCQRWTAEFKGITQPVLFMIFFYDFITPQKRNMSEGCSLFTLKMTVQS